MQKLIRNISCPIQFFFFVPNILSRIAATCKMHPRRRKNWYKIIILNFWWRHRIGIREKFHVLASAWYLPNAAYFYASTDKCTEVMCKMRPQNDVTWCSKRGSKRLQCSKWQIEWCSKEKLVYSNISNELTMTIQTRYIIIECGDDGWTGTVLAS